MLDALLEEVESSGNVRSDRRHGDQLEQGGYEWLPLSYHDAPLIRLQLASNHVRSVHFVCGRNHEKYTGQSAHAH